MTKEEFTTEEVKIKKEIEALNKLVDELTQDYDDLASKLKDIGLPKNLKEVRLNKPKILKIRIKRAKLDILREKFHNRLDKLKEKVDSLDVSDAPQDFKEFLVVFENFRRLCADMQPIAKDEK